MDEGISFEEYINPFGSSRFMVPEPGKEFHQTLMQPLDCNKITNSYEVMWDW